MAADPKNLEKAAGAEAEAEAEPRKMKLRILGFEVSPMPSTVPTQKMIYTNIFDFQMMVKPDITIKEIKNYTLAKYKTFNYYQLRFEFDNDILKDAVTVQNIYDKYEYFEIVKTLYLLITLPNETFKAMYNAFIDQGFDEETALENAKNKFMKTVKKTDVD